MVLGTLFFLAAMPWLFLNSQHPWFGGYSIWKQPKPAQYFYKRPDLALPYAETAGYLKSIGCRQIGLLTGEDNWEYPWWTLLADKGLRIEHIGVTNQSKFLKYPLGDFQPCAIISYEAGKSPLIMPGGTVYGPAGSLPSGITVYLRQ